MKILHVNTLNYGGAAVACNRLCRALRLKSIESEVLFREKETLFAWGKRYIGKILKKLLFRLLIKSSNPIISSLGIWSCGIVQKINQSDADIVHLHWINDQFLSIKDIANIKKPLVWTLHDSWTFCGAEHYQNLPEQDQRYKEGYTKNNFPKTSHGIDINRYIWGLKKKNWKNLPVSFVAPSHWEAGCLEESFLFLGKKCHVIHNCLDSYIFSPNHKQGELRAALKLPLDKNIILFGATNINDRIKGGDYLHELLQSGLLDKEKVHLLSFGSGISFFENLDFPSTFSGKITDERKLAQLYQVADVFLCPSRVDNLPNTCVESISCGTPVVAFRTGGIPDIIQHEKNGYLAEPYDIRDFAKGIHYCLNHSERLRANARKIAEEKFSEDKIAEQMKELYESLSK